MTTELDAGINAPTEEEKNTTTEGTNSEELETTEEEVETNTESEEEIDKDSARRRKNAEKAKKMLAEKNEAIKRIEILEQENAVAKLKLKFWDFDEAKLLEIKSQHPTLSYEDALKLAWWWQPLENQWTFAWIIWMQQKDTDSWTITYEQLRKMSAAEYNSKYEQIQAGKLKIVKG